MMLGAIDIGTNSVRLLLADHNLQVVERMIKTTRLGEGVNENRFLQPDPCLRTIKALKEFKEIVQGYDLSKLAIVATSAVRDAKNKDSFLAAVREELNWEIEVITGAREAYLTYLGVTADFTLADEKVLVFDLGGGSTEIILGQEREILNLQSLDVGAVRMTEKFLPGVITEYNCFQVKEYTRNLLQPYLSEYSRAKRIIGVGGTATSLAAMQQRLEPYDPSKVHGFKLNLKEITNIRKELALMSLAERTNWPGLQSKRADIILAGTLIAETLLEELYLDELTVSENDLLLGLIKQQA